ncbi:MAG: type VI secretion system tip protein VgrG [Sandaracinaceae bacterium]|nr:type VI secretion system tip protein VgrG [Sandaracinaceae bacterium]
MSDEYQIETGVGPLGPLAALELTERLDAPYELTLRFRAQDAGAPDPAASLEEDVVVVLAREAATERRVAGMVLAIEEAPERATEHVLRVGPALSLLALERKSRIFQEKTVPEILEQVLGEALGAYGRSVELDLRETYEPREYCCQLQETTLEFVQRLMAEEGISYTFDHSGEKELMQLRDRSASYPELAANDGARVTFSPHAQGALPEAIESFEPHHRMGRTKVTVRDHDWTGPESPEASDGGADEQGRERESYEHGLGWTLSIGSYDEGAKRYQKQDSARQAPLRLEADRALLTTMIATSTVHAIAPGLVLELVGHPEGRDGRYLVTSAEHRVSFDIRRGRVDDARNRFECIPAETAYRPARTTRKPRITSAEVARVVGPAGQEIHTDAHGRIKVQFPWDRDGQGDEHASCWMRVSQHWAGGGFGTLHVPRIGMEVVVQYVHGDPDRPLVTGTLYNGDNRPPYGLPDEKTKSTIKSNTSLGGGGYNEFRYEDKAGSEQIFVHAQKNYDEVVLANHTTDVGGDQTNAVHHDQTQTVHGAQTEDVHGNQTLKAESNRTVKVLSGFEETVDGTETRNVKSGVKETLIGGQERTVQGAVVETIVGGEKHTVIGGLTETLESTHTRAILGGATRVATGTFTHSASGATEIKAGGTITVLAASNFTVSGPPSITIGAPTVFSFSNQHDFHAGTHNKMATTKKAIFSFMFSLCAIKLGAVGTATALGIGKLAIYRQAVELVGASAGLNGLNLDKSGDKTTIAGLVINMKALKLWT